MSVGVCHVVDFLVGGYENFFFEKSVDFEPWKSRFLVIDEECIGGGLGSYILERFLK